MFERIIILYFIPSEAAVMYMHLKR